MAPPLVRPTGFPFLRLLINPRVASMPEAQFNDHNDDFTERFEALIFDCDGTLSHSMPMHFVAWRETMAGYGIDFAEDQFYSMAGMPSEKIIAVLCQQQGASVDANEAAEKKEAAFERLIDGIEPLERVCQIARTHHGRMPMAVASGGIAPIVRRQLVHLNIDSLFDCMVTSEDTELHKPEPDVFLEAARRLGVAADRCLVFEDSPLGFAAADAAQMAWIDVRPWYLA